MVHLTETIWIVLCFEDNVHRWQGFAAVAYRVGLCEKSLHKSLFSNFFIQYQKEIHDQFLDNYFVLQIFHTQYCDKFSWKSATIHSHKSI